MSSLDFSPRTALNAHIPARKQTGPRPPESLFLAQDGGRCAYLYGTTPAWSGDQTPLKVDLENCPSWRIHRCSKCPIDKRRILTGGRGGPSLAVPRRRVRRDG